MGKNAKLKEKQKWSNEKLHLENENCEGSISSSRRIRNSKKPSRTREKLGVILAHMCVKLQMRSNVCHRLGPFWVHFGSILGPFWVHFGSILGHFGSISGPFRVHFGSISGPFSGPFRVHFDYCLNNDAFFEGIEFQSAFRQEPPMLRQESIFRQESVFRQECFHRQEF